MSYDIDQMVNTTGLAHNRFLPSLSELEEMIPGFECGREFWHEVGNKLTLPTRRIAELTSLFFTHSNKDEITSVGDALLALSSSISGRALVHRHSEQLNHALRDTNLEVPIKISLKDTQLALPMNLLQGLSEGVPLSKFIKEDHQSACALLIESLLKQGDSSNSHLNIPQGQTIRILSLNIWGLPSLSGFGSKDPSRYPKIAERLSQGDWDVVFLQEVWDPKSLSILNTLKGSYHIFAPSTGRLYGQNGLAILSKFPIVDSATHSFEEAKGIERYVRKGAVFARLDVGDGKTLDVATTHFTSPPESVNCALVSKAETEMLRCRNALSLKKFLSKVRGDSRNPFICGGDFNAEEGGIAYAMLGETLGQDLMRLRLPRRWKFQSSQHIQESQVELHTFDPEKNTLARHSAHRPSRYDYFFGDLKNQDAKIATALRFNTEEDTFSDHYGIELTLTL